MVIVVVEIVLLTNRSFRHPASSTGHSINGVESIRTHLREDFEASEFMAMKTSANQLTQTAMTLD
jgi:hypothetical protein